MRDTGVCARRLCSLDIECLVSPILEPVMISLQVFYEGHVQGVGFRFTVRHIAKGFDVTGWVRNLPDGRVELQATGDEEARYAPFSIRSLKANFTRSFANKPRTS